MKYNFYHKEFGYVALSHLCRGDVHYYVHLKVKQAIDVKDGSVSSFIEAKGGLTLYGGYFDYVQRESALHPIIKFNRATYCRLFPEEIPGEEKKTPSRIDLERRI